jgi:hypothetical protein
MLDGDPMHVRRWLLLASGAAVVCALFAWCSRPLGAPGPSQGLALDPQARSASAETGQSIERRDVEPIAASAAASSLQTGIGRPGVMIQRRPEDPAVRQLLVQAALAEHQRGLAVRAAIAIGRCISLEGRAERVRAYYAEEQGLKREVVLMILAWQEEQLRLCQALDASSRAHWPALLRRGLEERVIGDAEQLLSAFQGSPFERQVAAEVMDAMRDDALACHEPSLFALYSWPGDKGRSPSSSETTAYWRALKDLFGAKDGESWQLLARGLHKPEQEGDPAEVQRLVDIIKSHC